MRTGRQDGGHPAPAAGEDRVAHRVHPVMHPMQPADADPVGDRVVVEPQLVQLPHGHDAILAGRERRDRGIDAS